MRGSVSFVTTLALLVPAGAVYGASGGELAQARPRPVQKGKGPIRPGETPPPTEAASAEAASTGADRTQSLAEVREKAQASLVEAAKAGDAPAAAQGVKALLPFVKLDDRPDAQVRAAVDHIENGELARAEKLLGEASAASTDAGFIGLAEQAVRRARTRAEEDALASITDVADPRPAAKILAAGRKVEPEGRRAAGAADQLARKIERRNLQMDDIQVARGVEALAILEDAAGDTVARLTKAAEAVEAGRFADAEAMFRDIRLSTSGPEASDVAAAAAGWVRARRVDRLEKALGAAQKDGDVLEESRVIQALRELDPEHREANRRARDIERRVLALRLKQVREAREAGKLGVAHLLATRGLSVDPENAGLRAAKKEIEAELKKRTDLIMVVESPRLEEGARCAPFAPVLQKEAMEVASRREDLGGYVLSEGWTEAWKNGDDRAPEVNGSLSLVVSACEVSPASGSATVQWSVMVPQGVEGTAVVSGEEEVRIAGAAIPREEQDREGKTARRALADQIATVVSERISESRDAMDAWLLQLAGYQMSQTRAAETADAWARFNLDRPVLFDEELASTVQTYLAREYR